MFLCPSILIIKSEFFDVFKKFKSMVKLQSGYPLRKMRIDRVGSSILLRLLHFVKNWEWRGN